MRKVFRANSLQDTKTETQLETWNRNGNFPPNATLRSIVFRYGHLYGKADDVTARPNGELPLGIVQSLRIVSSRTVDDRRALERKWLRFVTTKTQCTLHRGHLQILRLERRIKFGAKRPDSGGDRRRLWVSTTCALALWLSAVVNTSQRLESHIWSAKPGLLVFRPRLPSSRTR